MDGAEHFSEMNRGQELEVPGAPAPYGENHRIEDEDYDSASEPPEADRICPSPEYEEPIDTSAFAGDGDDSASYRPVPLGLEADYAEEELPDDPDPFETEEGAPTSLPVPEQTPEVPPPLVNAGEDHPGREPVPAPEPGPSEPEPAPITGRSEAPAPEAAESLPEREAAGPPPPPSDAPPPPGITGEGGEEPRLPSTANDVKWEEWHGGAVEVVAGEAPGSEVLKIYRTPGKESARPISILTPAGTTAELHPLDIVQVYPRDADGRVAEQPERVFQGAHYMPPEYIASGTEREPWVDGPELDALLNSPQGVSIQVEDPTNRLPPFRITATDTPEPMFGTRHPDRFWTSAISGIFGRGSWVEHVRSVSSGNPHESLEIYPFHGRPIHVVTPSGFLVRGRTHDIVEVYLHGPDGGYELTRRTFLRNIARDDRYMTL